MLVQTTVTKVPTIIPASTPFAVVFFHHKVSSMAGPKEAPNPAHAYDTIAKTNFFDVMAMVKAIIPTAMVIIRLK